MAVNRDREDVAALPEDILLAVAVVIVEVEDRDAGGFRKFLGGDGRVAEVAESPEGPVLGVVPRRPDESVGEAAPPVSAWAAVSAQSTARRAARYELRLRGVKVSMQ